MPYCRCVGASTTQILYETVCLNVLNWRKICIFFFLYIMYWWCLVFFFKQLLKSMYIIVFIFVTNTTDYKFVFCVPIHPQFPELCNYGLQTINVLLSLRQSSQTWVKHVFGNECFNLLWSTKCDQFIPHFPVSLDNHWKAFKNEMCL